MSPFQLKAVAVCLIINMLDGFDVLAIAFAAPAIASDWSLPPVELGILFSAGLAGMMTGSIFVAPLADRHGRRTLILICLIIISIGMLATAATQNLTQIIFTRLVTGIGVGSMLPSLNTMVAEYSSDRRRRLAVSFLQVGYPVGAIVAGVVSVYLINRFGWRSVFVFGGFLSILMLPLVYFRLPESLDFLLNRQPRNALRRVNTLLRQLRQPEVSGLPQLTDENANISGFSVLTSSTYRARTLFICVAFLITLSAWYFVINWTPKILVDAGLSLNAGISGGLLISVGGVAGGLSLGFLSTRFRLRRLVAAFMLSGAVVMTIFGQLDTQLSAMLVTAFALGFCLAGAMIGLYAIVADAYPAAVRSTGTGWAIGVGRLGAVSGPYVAGLLIAAGWDRALYFFTLAVPLLVAMILVLRLPGRRSSPAVQTQGRPNFEKKVQ